MPNKYRFRDLAGIGIPFIRPTIHRMVREDRFPKSFKLMNGTTAWRKADIDTWLAAYLAKLPA